MSRKALGVLVIEFKGKNVEHATKQIMETADFIKNVDLDIHAGKIAGLIVCRRLPAGASTDVQRQQVAFRKAYKGRLSVCCGNREHRLEDLVRKA